jgi:outer membrane biosynthesis protein TonB
MNSASKIAVLALLCVITGCRQKPEAMPPPAAEAPILPLSTLANSAPLPQLPEPDAPKVNPPEPDVAQQPPPPPPKTLHHKAKPADSAPTQAQTTKDTPAQTPATDQPASADEPPEMSPIGQLSSTSGSSSVQTRHDIQDEITATESGLNGIKRTLTADEQTTATQIRTFLAKAKQALEQDDLDGAHTLLTKAKVLLEELTKG